MKFYFGEFEWRIEEVDEAFIIEELQKREKNEISAAFGGCNYQIHTIWLNKDMCRDQKIQTLTHELTHCYLWCVGVRLEEYPEEMICDMMYTMINTIQPIVDKWKEENK